MSPSAQLNSRMDAVPPTRFAPGSGPTSRDRVASGGQTSGPPHRRITGQLPSPCGNVGNDRNTDPPRVSLAPPHGDGVGHGGAEATRDTPFPPLKRTCFRPTHRSPPRRAVCLPTGQHRQQTGRRREARALTNRWCLSVYLTPPPAVRRPSRAETPPLIVGAQGSTPATALVSGHYPGGLPG